VFNVLRKITNTMRDLEIKENRLTNDKMPLKRAKIMTLRKEQRMTQARAAFGTYKKYQRTRDQYWSLRENLERIKHELETSHTNVVVTRGFKEANVVMERMLTSTPLAEVDAIIDKCRDHMEQGEQIFDALSAPLDETFDEAEMDAEMEELIRMGDPDPQEIELPSVPVSSVVPSKGTSGAPRKMSRKHTKGVDVSLKTPLLNGVSE
jgi:hypothetical protein